MEPHGEKLYYQYFYWAHIPERKNEENSLQTQEFCQKGPCGRLILIMISWLEGNEVGLLPAQSIAWFFSSELASVGDFISSH